MNLELPYLPDGREILYVSIEDSFMAEAKRASEELSKDSGHPIGAVLVMDNEIVARGANGSDHHLLHGCERRKQNIPTGEGYELCPGCSPVNHAEQSLLATIEQEGKDVSGADVYLYGHWWCCESCWGRMIEVGIRDVYLVEGADKLFRK